MSQHTLTKPSITCDYKAGYQNDTNVNIGVATHLKVGGLKSSIDSRGHYAPSIIYESSKKEQHL